MTQVSKHDQGLIKGLGGIPIFTYYCLQTAEMAGGVGVGVEDELVEEELDDDELLVGWEVLEVGDCDDDVALGSGRSVSVQETVDIVFDVEEELDILVLERLMLERFVLEILVLKRFVLETAELFRLKVVEIGFVEDTLVFCWTVDVLQGPVTVTELGLVVVMNVEEFQEVVMLRVKVEGAAVGSVLLSAEENILPVAVEKPVQSLGM